MQYVTENFTIQALTAENFHRIWTESYLQNYAPLQLQLYALIHSVAGLDPAAYHLAQLLLHVVCVCVLYGVLRRFESPRVALLATLWFAVFPPNVETVAWVSEIKSTLAFILFLFSFHCFVRFRERGLNRDAALSAAFLFVSMLAKISTVVAPAVFLAYDWRGRELPPLARLKSLAPFVGISLLFVVIHLYSSHDMQAGAIERLRDAAITTSDTSTTTSAAQSARSAAAPASPQVADDASQRYFGGLGTHVLNLPGLLWHYLRNTLVPQGLSPWRMVPIETALSARAALLWAGLLGLLLLIWRLQERWRFWLLWFLLFLAPVLQLVPNATWVADRYLYIPAVGIFVVAAKLFFLALDRVSGAAVRAAAEAVMLAGLALLGWQAIRYTSAWSDELTLWKSALSNCSTSAFCNFKVGDAELDAQMPEAIIRLERAVAIHPETTYLVARARAYTDLAGDYGHAAQLFEQLQLEGRKLQQSVITSIARNHYLAGNLDRANKAVQAGLGLNPEFSSLLLVRGLLEWRAGNFPAARATLRHALELNRSNARAQHAPRFLLEFWQRPAEVGALLRALGPL